MHASTWGSYKLLITILSCCNEISAKWTSLLHFCFFFTLIFGVSLNSALCRLIIFISIKRCGILSFLTHYPVHISIDIQHDILFFLLCFQSLPLIFLSSVYKSPQLLDLLVINAIKSHNIGLIIYKSQKLIISVNTHTIKQPIMNINAFHYYYYYNSYIHAVPWQEHSHSHHFQSLRFFFEW